MFAAPPKFSEDDLRRGETEAASTMQRFLTTSAVLYISPFIIEAIWKFI